MRAWIKGMAIIGVIIACTACQNNEEPSANNESDSPEVNEEATTPNNSNDEAEEESFTYTSPLTGVGTNDETTHRAFGVMIENSAQARPQTGLYQADVVYEVLSEGRITRMLAIYHSTRPDDVGPVRSARDYYIFLNNGFDAIYASAGGSPQAFELIQRGAVNAISGLEFDGIHFRRSSDRSAPHNLYTSYDDLVAAAERLGFTTEDMEPPALPFNDNAISENTIDVNEVSISYGSALNDVSFDYYEELSGYIRSVGGEPMNDYIDDNPVAPRNLFIVEANHRVIDDVGRRDIDIESGGRGYLIYDGQAVEVDWQNEEGIILPFQDEEALSFLPGRTWISIVPSLDDVTLINE
ncbi:DUF3048 domain-containing protein [Paenalkalicoccus suaedae]|uniref:DUF3048 domain-containing protein n=1 Tax=Paenalkalicoccus suaedae TaxID=2592382 RepID=A0A859FDY2_9BACI|nr:DUF3048 domain-containing protein [Paenalkalicoccus suaedae]QKS70436.1 DUF3048 domain-containing protein [Paenalkalicoccus suaedae]